MKLFTLHISHRHGENISIHPTHEDAFIALADYSRQWWTKEGMEGEPPESNSDAVRQYWDHVQDESSNIEEHEVDGVVPMPESPSSTIRPYTVIVRHPDYADQDDNGWAGTFHTHVTANSPEEAISLAQIEGCRDTGREMDEGVVEPEDWAVVAVFAGHLECLHTP